MLEVYIILFTLRLCVRVYTFISFISYSILIFHRSNSFNPAIVEFLLLFFHGEISFPSVHRRKKYNTLWLKWFSCVRCYEPRMSVRRCAAMSHPDLNREMTGFAGMFGIFSKNTALFAFASDTVQATGLRDRHVASLHALAFARVLKEIHVASLHALAVARVLSDRHVASLHALAFARVLRDRHVATVSFFFTA